MVYRRPVSLSVDESSAALPALQIHGSTDSCRSQPHRETGGMAIDDRDAAQLAPHAEALPSAASDNATANVASALQCPACRRQLCQPQDLCFFSRYPEQGGHEVHLIVKPELPHMPPSFTLAPITAKGSTQSWQCPCGHHLGDTRPIGPNKALMTAFKSASVMLYGQHHPGKKSKWPTLYSTLPFNNIEVRTRDTFRGSKSCSSAAQSALQIHDSPNPVLDSL